VQHLSSLYGGEFTLKGVDTVMTLQILAASCALGMAGAWLAASQHLWKEQ
jgi:cell division protein FtsX